MKAIGKTLRALIIGVALIQATAAHAADAVADFYKGKTVTIIVGSPPGGIYDLYARAVARYLGKYLPGNPNVIVQQMPGSGAIAAVNHVYNIAPHDGTVLVAPSNTTAFLPMLGVDQAKFDPKKMLWLGSPTQETGVFFVWHTSTAKTFDDAKTQQVLVGSNGPQGHSGIMAKVLNDIFKTKLKSIDGYQDPADSFLAMERGEIEGRAGIFYNQLKAGYSEQLADGRIRVLLHYGAKPNPDLVKAGVPYGPDLIASKEDRQILDAASAPLAVGYPLVMGPDIPADRRAAMLKAIDAIYHDKTFLEEAAKQRIDIAPISGTEIEKTIADSYAMAPGVIARFRKLYDAAE